MVRLIRSFVVVACSLLLAIGGLVVSAPPATAATNCDDPACAGIESDRAWLANQLLGYAKANAFEATSYRVVNDILEQEIRPIAEGRPKPGCDVDTRVLQTLVIVVRKYGGAKVSELNRDCPWISSDVTCASNSSSRHCTTPSQAIDFVRIGSSTSLTGGNESKGFLQFLDSFFPKGSGAGQVQFKSQPFALANITDQFNDDPGHQHVDFGHTTTQLSIPTDSSNPSFLDVLKRRPSGNVGTPASGHEVFTAASGGVVNSAWFTSGVGWSGWASHGGTQMSNITVGYNSTGNEEVFATDSSGTVYHRWFTSGAGWSSWASLGASNMHDLTVGYNGAGGLELYGIAGGVVYETWFTAGVGWAPWASLGGSNMSSLTVSYNTFGNEEVFAIGAGGVAFSTYFTPGAGWSGWSPLGGSNLTQLAAITTQGEEELFAVGGDQKIYHKWFTPGSGWSAWASLGGTGMSNLVAGVNTQGNKEIFVTAGGVVYTTWFTPGVGWANWASLGSSGITSLSLGYATDGTEDLFGIGGGGTVFHTSFSQGAGWSNWASLGGSGMRFK